MSEESETLEARAKRPATAVLLIHGIGEQRPYETLDAFVQGISRECGVQTGTLQHRLTVCGGTITSSVRVPLPDARTLDVYEFHWAGLVEGRLRLHQVLWWLIRTALTPLRLRFGPAARAG